MISILADFRNVLEIITNLNPHKFINIYQPSLVSDALNIRDNFDSSLTSSSLIFSAINNHLWMGNFLSSREYFYFFAVLQLKWKVEHFVVYFWRDFRFVIQKVC